MRPRKTVLLVGADETRISCLRYLLDLNYFATQPSASAREASTLAVKTHFDLLIVDWPLEGAAQLLKSVKAFDPGTNSLLLAHTETHTPEGCVADMTLVKYGYTNGAVLDMAKTLSARKRGPRLGRKPVVSVGCPDIEVEKLG